MIKVKAVQDYDAHWYLIPNELIDDFYKDCDNEDMTDSGEFDDKYNKYRTHGDVNLTQLYIEE